MRFPITLVKLAICDAQAILRIADEFKAGKKALVGIYIPALNAPSFPRFRKACVPICRSRHTGSSHNCGCVSDSLWASARPFSSGSTSSARKISLAGLRLHRLHAWAVKRGCPPLAASWAVPSLPPPFQLPRHPALERIYFEIQ